MKKNQCQKNSRYPAMQPPVHQDKRLPSQAVSGLLPESIAINILRIICHTIKQKSVNAIEYPI